MSEDRQSIDNVVSRESATRHLPAPRFHVPGQCVGQITGRQKMSGLKHRSLAAVIFADQQVNTAQIIESV